MKRILSGIIAFSVFILILIFSACSHETAESSDFVNTLLSGLQIRVMEAAWAVRQV